MVYFSLDNDPTLVTRHQPEEKPPPLVLEAMEQIEKLVAEGKFPPDGVALIAIPKNGPIHEEIEALLGKPPQIHYKAGGIEEKTLIVDPTHECFVGDKCKTCKEKGDCPLKECVENAAVAFQCDSCGSVFTIDDDDAAKVREKYNCLLEGSIVMIFVKTCPECSESAHVYKVVEIRKE